MNDFEKQSLRNQRLIMMKLNLEEEGDFKDTEALLNPEKVPTLAERTNDALCEEVKN